MHTNKKLKYITVRYDCSDELAERICNDFDIESNSNSFLCINSLLTDDYSGFINFNCYIKPKYKKLMFVNFSNIRRIYNVRLFNYWMEVVNMFDEIYDTHIQVEEYRPHIQNRVKFYKIEESQEIKNEYLKVKGFNDLTQCSCIKNIQDHTAIQSDTLSRITVFPENFENLKIGRFCSLGNNITILINRNHNIKNITTHRLNVKYNNKDVAGSLKYKGDIVIDNDVWVGNNVTLLPNIHIGDGAVIGTSAVVTKDIPPYAIVGGNPAKVLKYRFSKKQIKKLLKIKWWDWPLYQIYDNIELFETDNIDGFIEKFYKIK